MEKMVEVERATQDELRQDLKSLFQGADSQSKCNKPSNRSL